MAKEYIEREPLKRDLIDRGFYPAIVKAAIEAAPAADVVAVVHGKWIKNGNRRTCSVCGFEYHTNGNSFNGCPMCLAKMDGKDLIGNE